MKKIGLGINVASLSVIMAWMALSVHGCYPQKLSPECQAQISACLKSCPQEGPAEPPPNVNGDGLEMVDVRSNCESLCHGKCR